ASLAGCSLKGVSNLARPEARCEAPEGSGDPCGRTDLPSVRGGRRRRIANPSYKQRGRELRPGASALYAACDARGPAGRPPRPGDGGRPGSEGAGRESTRCASAGPLAQRVPDREGAPSLTSPYPPGSVPSPTR